MKRTIFVFSSGELHRKENTLFFKTENGERKYIPVENTNEIYIFGEVTINKKLLDFLSQNEIILHFYNYYGYYTGSFYPRMHYNSGFMIIKQVEAYLDKNRRMELACKFVLGAILNILKVLKYYANRGKDLLKYINSIEKLKIKLEECRAIDELMAIEGNIKGYYYNAFDEIINKEEFVFIQRTKQPPKNRLNALISFGNSLLYTVVLSEIYKTHLDPRIGFLHATNFRRFSLNLDIAEIFKPIIVDRVIFTLINKNMIDRKCFMEEVGGIYLNENGRRRFVEEFDNRLRTTISDKGLARNISYRSLIRRDLYKLEKDLMGEREYRPFIARW